MTNRNEAILPVASRIDADASAVAVGARLDRAIGATVDPRRRNWLFPLLLVVGWLGQAGLRAWFSRAQAVPLDNPDETAYLIAARFLGGGPAADFSGSTLYRGGYPLLITPVYWFTSSPAAVYRIVLLINAAVSAAVMPLGYLVCRRLGLGRPAAYGVAMVAALLPAGFFYSEYAIADAIFPVVTLAWLLAIHSWLVATSPRARYAAAVGSAVLSGYAYAVHPRGLVLLAGFAAVGVFIAWRRPAARGSVAAAALTVVVTAGAGWTLDRYLASALYPEGTRSLSGQLVNRLDSVYGVLHVAEMAGGQLWRLVLDSWGIAGIGLVAAVAAIARRGVRTDLRVMASLAVGVTVLIACTAPAALARRSEADLGLRTLPGRHDRHVLPGRRSGAAAGGGPADPRLRRLRRGRHYGGRRDGGRVRRNIPAHGAREGVQLRRACRADPELEPGQRPGGNGVGAGPAPCMGLLRAPRALHAGPG